MSKIKCTNKQEITVSCVLQTSEDKYELKGSKWLSLGSRIQWWGGVGQVIWI